MLINWDKTPDHRPSQMIGRPRILLGMQQDSDFLVQLPLSAAFVDGIGGVMLVNVELDGIVRGDYEVEDCGAWLEDDGGAAVADGLDRRRST